MAMTNPPIQAAADPSRNMTEACAQCQNTGWCHAHRRCLRLDKPLAAAAPAGNAGVREALDTEEKYLLGHFDAECGIMSGDVQGSFHRLRETLALPQPREAEGEIERLRADRDKWHHIAMEAGAVTCTNGVHIYPLKDEVRLLRARLSENPPQPREAEPVAWRVVRGHKMYVGMVTADPKVRDVWLEAELGVETLYASSSPIPEAPGGRDPATIEACALIAEGFDAACDSRRMKLFVDAGLVIAVYKRDGEIGQAIRALKPQDGGESGL